VAARGASIGRDDRGFDAELVRGAGLALTDAFDLWRVKGIELPSALALLLGTDLLGTQQQPLESGLEFGPVGAILGQMSRMMRPRRLRSRRQLSMMALELLA
jgi:hypothetical protein